MKNVRSSQPCISMNFCTDSVNHKFFHVSIVNQNGEFSVYMLCFVGFGTICTILKMWKTTVEKCYFLVMLQAKACGCSSCFSNCTNGTESGKASHIYCVFSLIHCVRLVLATLAYYSYHIWLTVFRIYEAETFREYIIRLFLKVFL